MNELINFDYQQLNREAQVLVRSATERMKVRMKRTAQDIVETGQDLIEIKSILTHGQFLAWLDAEFEMAERTARNFIQVAQKFGSKTAKFADFKPSILYELASPSTPQEVIDHATKKAEAGESVSVKEIQELKRKHKQQQELLNAQAQRIAKAEAIERELAELQSELSLYQADNHSLEDELLNLKLQMQKQPVQVQIEKIEVESEEFKKFKQSGVTLQKMEEEERKRIKAEAEKLKQTYQKQIDGLEDLKRKITKETDEDISRQSLKMRLDAYAETLEKLVDMIPGKEELLVNEDLKGFEKTLERIIKAKIFIAIEFSKTEIIEQEGNYGNTKII